ncbi:hypothetical protein OIU84_022879 [Salix udensis]|uniref:Uncharacterized protein n=1 Tax=Salix udensis TaxID=889485 RepID=A0AAD6KPU2_9ROSI|nr:hypothetical protein OIU84_022879 [Salix udensis]
MEGTVWKLAYEVEVSNYRPGFWARWPVEFAAAETAGYQDKGYSGKPRKGVGQPRFHFAGCGFCWHCLVGTVAVPDFLYDKIRVGKRMDKNDDEEGKWSPRELFSKVGLHCQLRVQFPCKFKDSGRTP